MYQHILIPTDGSEVAERAVTHGLSLAKFVGAKITVIIVEERLGVLGVSGLARHGAFSELTKLEEQIKKDATSVLDRVATATKHAGVPCDTTQMEGVQPMKPSLQRPRTGAAISSSWHRTDAADYPQLCLAV